MKGSGPVGPLRLVFLLAYPLENRGSAFSYQNRTWLSLHSCGPSLIVCVYRKVSSLATITYVVPGVVFGVFVIVSNGLRCFFEVCLQGRSRAPNWGFLALEWVARVGEAVVSYAPASWVGSVLRIESFQSA